MEINTNEMGEVSFEDIKVGEVFGAEGCFGILYKNTENTAILLADDGVLYPNQDVCSSITGEEYTYKNALFQGEVLYIALSKCKKLQMARSFMPNSCVFAFGDVYSENNTGFYRLPKKYQRLFLSE